MRRRRGPWIAMIGVFAVLVTIAGVGLGRTPATPAPSGRSGTASEPPGSGPVVYSEIVDADGAVLVERRLDGHSLPRRVAIRPGVDVGRIWTVDPTGTMAVAVIGTRDGQRMEAVAIADGSDRWSLDVPAVELEEATWSADGHRLAVINRPSDVGPTQVIVVDVRDGHAVRTIVPPDAVLQGFDPDDALVLRVRLPDEDVAGWRFLRVDPDTNAVQEPAELPAVGPASASSEDADPRHGLAVVAAQAPDHLDVAIQAWPLGGGPSRTLATLPAADDLAIDPAGHGVVVDVNHDLRLIHWDGHSTDLWSSDASPTGLSWSTAGDYLGFTVDRAGSNLVVLELATGRAVEVPQVDRVAQSTLLRVVGGVPLPAAALPAVEPGPTPTPAPVGPDLAGAPAIASAWLATVDGHVRLHVDRLVPTSEGGMRIAGSMAPVDVGPPASPDDDGPLIRLLPRPGSSEILVWARTADRGRGWLWNGAAAARPLKLPPGWPARADDVAWRPDGRALAATDSAASEEGDSEGGFVVAELGGTWTRAIPIAGDYDRLQGWWSTSELKVGHDDCSGGCAGTYAWSARVRVADGRLTQLEPNDRARGPIDEVSADGRGGLRMSAGSDHDAGDIRIDWPSNGTAPEGPDFIGFAADHRSLLVADQNVDGTDLYRVDDPARHAIAGRAADPVRTLLGHVPRRGLGFDVAPDARWARTTDRVGTVQLVELATGRTWPLDRDRTLAWWPGA